MKKKLLFCSFFAYMSLFSQSPLIDSHWELLWSDEFNGSINQNIWKIQDNYDHWSYAPLGVHEPQVYTSRPQNVKCDANNLIITLNKENYSCPPDYVSQWWCTRQNALNQPYNYTSGWIETKGIYRPKYGYIEARIQATDGFGFWPAFWTLSEQISSGTPYQEIDIFEFIPGSSEKGIYVDQLPSNFKHNKNSMTTNLHYNSTNETGLFGNLFQINLINDYTQWHKYAIEWSPSKITWYLDNQIIRTEKNNGIFDPATIILNVAMQPINDKFFISSQFPAEMRVDYVRYYQLIDQCTTNINSCNYNFSNHSNIVKGSYILGGTGCAIFVPQNQSYIFRATDQILINADFTIPLGSQIYLDVNSCY